MIVLYSCAKCGLQKIEVVVPDREAEDVVQWLEQIAAPLMSRDHDARSPDCCITELSEVYIPVPPGTDKLGRPPSN